MPFLWGIGFHKDKTLDLDEEAPIVSISLGRPGRPYILRDNIFQPTQQSFGLWQIGDILWWMKLDVNEEWWIWAILDLTSLGSVAVVVSKINRVSFYDFIRLWCLDL